MKSFVSPEYLKECRLRQNFSFRSNIIEYITKQPTSPKGYQKIIQTCKYFFAKNPILVIEKLHDSYGCITVENGGYKKEIDTTDEIFYKIWITEEIYNYCEKLNNNIASNLIPKLYKCDISRLTLCFQVIPLKYLILIGSNANYVVLAGCKIVTEDGNDATLDHVFECFRVINDFVFHFRDNEIASTATLKCIIEGTKFLKLQYFALYNINDSFDFEAFMKLIKINKTVDIYLYFRSGLSEEYCNRIKTIVNDIVTADAAGEINYFPPHFCYSGLYETATTLHEIHEKYLQHFKASS